MACRKNSKPVEEEKCFLCDKYPSNTRRALVAHIGKHMEEVAMMALPKDHMDDSGHSSESDDGNIDINDQSNDASRTIITEGPHLWTRQPSSDIRWMIAEPINGKSTSMNTILTRSKSKTTRPGICTYPGCAFCYDNEQDLDAHTDTHMATPPKGHKCPYCSESFTRHGNLKRHLLNHSPEKPYYCETCEAHFRGIHDLKRRTNRVHPGERIQLCPKCHRSFASLDDLTEHVHDPGACWDRYLAKEDSSSESDMINYSGTKDLSSKPRCQRCRNRKIGCDRQRPCQRCKDAGIGPEGCIPEGDGKGRKGRYGKYMGVSVRKDSSSSNIADTSSHNDERVQNEDHELNLWPPNPLEDDFDFDGHLNEVGDSDFELLPGLSQNVDSAKIENRSQKKGV